MRTIMQKLMVLTMVSAAASLSLSFLVFICYDLYRLKHETAHRMDVTGDMIAQQTAASVAFGDEVALNQALSVLKADRSILHVVILNSERKTITVYNRSGPSLPATAQETGRSQQISAPSLFNTNLKATYPITRNDENLGWVVLEIDGSVIFQRVISLVMLFAVLLLGALLLAYLIGRFSQRLVGTPLHSLMKRIEHIAATKDYSTRVTIESQDEVGQLAERFNGMLREIEERDLDLRREQESLSHMANYDSLTDLPNRFLFSDRLESALRQSERKGNKIGLLFLDLDDFKNINDLHGHRIGDLLLIETALRLKSAVRGEDTLARMGGDEFTAILPDISSQEDAMKLAVRILQSLKKKFVLDGKELYISSSIGIAFYPNQARTAQELMRCADAAMYCAKEAGKNKIQLYSDELLLKLTERNEILHDLKYALAEGAFELYYQPKIELATGYCVGAEALIRWNHPTRGLVPPDMFIPLAEETGLILPIGEWVIEEASRQMKKWHQLGFYLPNLSINISPVQIRSQDIGEIVRNCAQLNDNCFQTLELEITETAVLDNLDRAIEVLSSLKILGVKVSMDDFGTGYSSLSMLNRLPIDTLKIDRFFLRDIDKIGDDVEIVSAIVAMASKLKLEVVIEGIETALQAQFAFSTGCSIGQGHRYGKPKPAKEFMKAMQGGKEKGEKYQDNFQSPVLKKCPLLEFLLAGALGLEPVSGV